MVRYIFTGKHANEHFLMSSVLSDSDYKIFAQLMLLKKLVLIKDVDVNSQILILGGGDELYLTEDFDVILGKGLIH